MTAPARLVLMRAVVGDAADCAGAGAAVYGRVADAFVYVDGAARGGQAGAGDVSGLADELMDDEIGVFTSFYAPFVASKA